METNTLDERFRYWQYSTDFWMLRVAFSFATVINFVFLFLSFSLYQREAAVQAQAVLILLILSIAPFISALSPKSVHLYAILTATAHFVCALWFETLTAQGSCLLYFVTLLPFRLVANKTIFDNAALTIGYLLQTSSGLNSDHENFRLAAHLLVLGSFFLGQTVLVQFRNVCYARWDVVRLLLIYQIKCEKELSVANEILLAGGPRDFHTVDVDHSDISPTHEKKEAVVINKIVAKAVALKLVPNREEYSRLVRAIKKMVVVGLRQELLTVIAIKFLVSEDCDCMLNTVRSFAVFDFIDTLAAKHKVSFVRRVGGVWVGCLGYSSSTSGSCSTDCSKMIELAMDVIDSAIKNQWKLSVAVGCGATVGGYVEGTFFDLFGEAVRWVMDHVEYRKAGTILVSDSVQQMLVRKKDNNPVDIPFKFEKVQINHILSSSENRKVYVASRKSTENEVKVSIPNATFGCFPFWKPNIFPDRKWEEVAPEVQDTKTEHLDFYTELIDSIIRFTFPQNSSCYSFQNDDSATPVDESFKCHSEEELLEMHLAIDRDACRLLRSVVLTSWWRYLLLCVPADILSSWDGIASVLLLNFTDSLPTGDLGNNNNNNPSQSLTTNNGPIRSKSRPVSSTPGENKKHLSRVVPVVIPMHDDELRVNNRLNSTNPSLNSPSEMSLSNSNPIPGTPSPREYGQSDVAGWYGSSVVESPRRAEAGESKRREDLLEFSAQLSAHYQSELEYSLQSGISEKISTKANPPTNQDIRLYEDGMALKSDRVTLNHRLLTLMQKKSSWFSKFFRAHASIIFVPYFICWAPSVVAMAYLNEWHETPANKAQLEGMGLVFFSISLLPYMIIEKREWASTLYSAYQLLRVLLVVIHVHSTTDLYHRDLGGSFNLGVVFVSLFFFHQASSNSQSLLLGAIDTAVLIVALSASAIVLDSHGYSYVEVVLIAVFLIFRLVMRWLLEYEHLLYAVLRLNIMPNAKNSYTDWLQVNKKLITGGVPNPPLQASTSMFIPSRFAQGSLVSVYVAAELMTGYASEAQMRALLRCAFTVIDKCFIECGVLKVSQFGGVYTGFTCDEWSGQLGSGLRSLMYGEKAVVFIRTVQKRLESRFKDLNISVVIGIGLSHGPVTVGLLGNRVKHFDIVGSCRDLAYIFSTHDAHGVYASEYYKKFLLRSSRNKQEKQIDFVFNNVPQKWLKIDGTFHGIQLYDFDFICTLGQGGYGSVHLVQEKSTCSQYAIKMIPRRMETLYTTLIQREVYALQQLKHQNVVTFVHCIFTPLAMYLVMDYVNAGNLKQVVDKYHLDVSHLQYWFAELVSALNHVHTRGIIHRDVKPANCMIGSDGHLKLVDFGLSKIISKGSFKEPHSPNEIDRQLKIFQKIIPAKPSVVMDGIELINEVPVQVLLVDSHPDSLTVHQLQQMYRMNLTCVNTSAKATDLLQNAKIFEVILIDIDSPENEHDVDAENFKLLLQLCRASPIRMIPIIALTSGDDMQTRRECISAGAMELIMKPITSLDQDKIIRWGKMNREKDRGVLRTTAPATNNNNTYNNSSSSTGSSSSSSSPLVHLNHHTSTVATAAAASVVTSAFAAASISGGAITVDSNAVLHRVSEETIDGSKDFSMEGEGDGDGDGEGGREGNDAEAKGFNRHSAVGTMHYLAPEVVKDRVYGKPVDWWACGVTFYECIARRHLFEGPDTATITAAILTGPIDLSILKMHSESLEKLVSGLLDRDQKTRFDYKKMSAHPFFKGLRLDKIHEIPPTFKPAHTSITRQGDPERSYFYGKTNRKDRRNIHFVKKNPVRVKRAEQFLDFMSKSSSRRQWIAEKTE